MTRGERNNNPFNLRISSIPWVNKTVPSFDKDFEQFSDILYGLRAGFMDLHNQARHGCNTIRAIINRYAPSIENDTDSYIIAVAEQTSLGTDEVLDLYSTDILFELGKAIITHENGECIYKDEQLKEALALIDGLSD